jgi:integrating conjugative element protein (TIGR03749 family)
LTLPVGDERYIWFPGRVQPGIPPELTSKLRVQAVKDTIYLLARESFETTRLPVRDLESGDFYLFDVRTDGEASSTPLRVVKTAGRDEGALTERKDDGAASSDAAEFGYVELTRFAAQQIYAPKRLAEQKPGISKVPLPATGQPSAAFYRGGEVTVTPVASWRGQSGLYVTAVKITNATQNRLALDPRLARGDWLAATFHHRELGPSGEANDTSALYLISDRPFLEVAEPWLG